jgi:predicted esterase
MFNFFKLFKRKPRIIPFYTLGDDEKDLLEIYRQLTPENKCKVLSFKANQNPRPAVNPTGEYNNTSFEYRNYENPPDNCKLDFIWDHLP